MSVQKVNNKLKGINPHKLWERALSIFLLVIWIFPFASDVFASEQHPYDLNKSELNTEIAVLTSNDVDSSNPQPFSPNLPESTPEEQDEFDEKEKDDNSENDWKILCKTSLRFDTSLEKALIARNTQSIQNRNSVYLFILFQSWKIFFARF
jgi:hypothetical protein